MKIADVLALTRAKQRTLYSWMKRHPTISQAEPGSVLGQPFPKPKGKAGREVVWDSAEVEQWWEVNKRWLGRHPEEGVATTVSDDSFLRAMQEPVEEYVPDPTTNSLLPVHSLANIESVERLSPGKLRVTFGEVRQAVEFKLRWGS